MEVVTTRKIVSNGKEFRIGDDVHFCLGRDGNTYDCFGVIKEIGENMFTITRVQMDDMALPGELSVNFSEVKGGVLKFTDGGWY